MINRIRDVALFRSISLGRFQSLLGYQHSNSVSGYQMLISSSGKIQQKLPGLLQISRSQQEQPGPAWTPWEVLCHASFNEVKSTKDVRPMKHSTPSYASIWSLSVEFYLYSLQTSYVLPWILPQQSTMWVCITWYTQKLSISEDNVNSSQALCS